MSDALTWERDGRDWPNRASSRFVAAGGFTWHVQDMGSGPVALLAHGTGASTHSWRALMPLLARHFRVIAPDLPGHGFTETPAEVALSLPGMSLALSRLVEVLAVDPMLAVGHSAGAAILLRATLDGGIAPKAVVSLNGALMPFRGLAGQIFQPLARLLFVNPFVARLFAMRAADRGTVERLLNGTGSTLDAEGLGYYERLFRSPAHVGAALAMMAHWDLRPLLADLPRLQPMLLLVANGNDRAISPDDAFRVRDMVPSAKVEYVRELGHLAHEENPELTARIIVDLARASGVLAPG